MVVLYYYTIDNVNYVEKTNNFEQTVERFKKKFHEIEITRIFEVLDKTADKWLERLRKLSSFEMGWIYKLNSPSKKEYVGQTEKATIDIRTDEHTKEAKYYQNKEYKGGCRLLNNVILKYGIDNIEQEIVFPCMVASLDFWETACIKYYNTLAPNGYNLTTGGNRKKKLCDVAKKQISTRVMESLIKLGTKLKRADHNKGLPMYMSYFCDKRIEGYEGYTIRNHPKCKTIIFATNVYKTLEECKKICLKYLNWLNNPTLEKPILKQNRTSKHAQDLPRYLMWYEKKNKNNEIINCGYKLTNHPKLRSKTLYFLKSVYKTLDKAKEMAISYVNWLENPDKYPEPKLITRRRDFDKNLPRYMRSFKYTSSSGKVYQGFRIQNHPNCKNKMFNHDGTVEDAKRALTEALTFYKTL